MSDKEKAVLELETLTTLSLLERIGMIRRGFVPAGDKGYIAIFWLASHPTPDIIKITQEVDKK